MKFLPFALQGDFLFKSKKKNRVFTLRLTFDSISKVRIEFLPFALHCYLFSKVRIEFLTFWLFHVIFFSEVKNRVLSSLPCDFISKVKIEFLPFSLPCDLFVCLFVCFFFK